MRRWPLVAIALLGVVIVAGWVPLAPDGAAATPPFYVFYLVTSLMAGVMAWIAAFRGGPAATRPWRWIAAGFTVLVVPQPLAIGYAIAGDAAMAKASALAVLIGRLLWAVLVLIGILRFPMTPLSRRQRLRLVADTATVIGGGFLVAWLFQLGPALENGDVGSEALVVLGFPITDLALIFGMCVLAMRNGIRTLGGPLPVFLLGLFCHLVADTFFSVAVLKGPVFWDGPLALGPFTAALIMAAAAAIHVGEPAREVPPPPPPRVQSTIAYLPYAGLVAGYAMLLVAAGSRGDLIWAGVVAGVILMTGAVVARQVIAMRENHSLIVRDSLTGLANRRSVDAALEAAEARHQRGGDASAVLLIDLDDFKAVNDTLGHDAGDAMLIAFAGVLRDTIRGSDLAGRIGGDEFVVVLDRPGSSEQALAVARRILAAAAKPADRGPSIRASVGVAMTDPAADAVAVRQRADMAMYAAKRAGRHGAELWHEDIPDDRLARDTMDADLAAAVERGELRALYQPIVALATGQVVAAEALVRWEHPTLGTVMPDRFIPLAERTGDIEAIGLWVLEEAAARAVPWRPTTGRRHYISVNLSPRQLSQPDLVDRVRDVLGRTGLDPHDLVLELTENALAHEAEAVEPLERLRALGVRIAVDDFGTGYSSLRYLSRLPVDILKLDRCFVSELNGDARSSAVAEAVIRLAQAMDLDTVAEGIEIPAQATELTLLGYRTGQGYHYARPMAASAFEALLADAGTAELRNGKASLLTDID